MSQLTDYAENKVTDALWRGQALGAPATWYVALFSAAPSDTGGGTELSGNSYARVAVTASTAAWAGTQSAGSTTASSGTSGTTSNNAAITFPTASGAWSAATHWGIFDASSAGNLWIWAALTTAKTAGSGDTLSFANGQLTLTVA